MSARPGKSGTDGRPWVELEHPKPTPVGEAMDFWLDPPPNPSEACTYWVRQIERGWLPNRRISSNGYHSAAEWYGVYIWEYLNVIYPLIRSKRKGPTE